MKKFLSILIGTLIMSILILFPVYGTEELHNQVDEEKNTVQDETTKNEVESNEVMEAEIEDSVNVSVTNSASGLVFIDTPINNSSYDEETNNVKLKGWAIASDSNATLKLYVNNCCWGDIARDSQRPDVKESYPNYATTTDLPGFSYDIDISAFPKGTHEIRVDEVASNGQVVASSAVNIKVKQNDYTGVMYIDEPGNNQVFPIEDTEKITLSGWAVSNDKKATVKLYVNNCCWGDIARVGQRQDVKSVFPQYASTTDTPGFKYDMNIAAFPAGTHEIKVEQVARDGKALSTATIQIRVTQNEYSGAIIIDTPGSNTTYNISDTKSILLTGWAVSNDKNATVKLYVNNCCWGNISRNVERQDVRNAFPSYANATPTPGFIYNMDIAAFPEGTHQIKVEEVSQTGKVLGTSIVNINISTPIYSAILHIDNPVTNTRYASGIMKIYGWAVSNAPEDYVSIYLDDVYQTGAERQAREDVIAMHGQQFGLDNSYKAGIYSEISTGNLGEGSHSVKVIQYSKYGKKIAEEKINFIISNTLTWGIDVSHYQGNIDWNAVKNSGVNFAILKIGEYRESSGRILVDDHFEQYYNECKRVGIAVGGYFYSYAFNPTEAAHEADACTQIISGKGFEMPIFFDIEDKVVINAVKTGRTNVVNLTNAVATFCNIMNSRGYQSGVYSYKLFFNQYLDMSKLQNYNIWLAHYVGTTDFSGRYDIWQYTSSGAVAGINGAVDLNWCYKRYY